MMRKKMICLTLAAVLLLGTMPAYASIADEEVVYQAEREANGNINAVLDKVKPAATKAAKLPDGAVRILVNDKELTARGVVVDYRTLVPLRALGQALGATVNWDAAKQEIRIEKTNENDTERNQVILMYVGKKQILKNGTAAELDVEPQIINGTTMVPVKVVADFFGAKASWDSDSYAVSITSENQTGEDSDQGEYHASQNVNFDLRPNDMSYIEYLSNYGIEGTWEHWTEETFISVVNDILTNALFISNNQGEYVRKKLPEMDSFGTYEHGVKLSKLTNKVMVGILTDPETNLIDVTSTAIFWNNRDLLDARTFVVYTIGLIFMGDMDFNTQEAVDLVTEVINDVLKTGSKTVTKNSLTVMATYDTTNDLMQINISHSKK